jgi:DNA mismatch endonuclease, patch repair protein
VPESAACRGSSATPLGNICGIDRLESPEPVTDSLSPDERSERMRRVRSKHTRPELALRRLVHGLGYRYRLHSRGVPGHPDLSIKKRRKAIFVHGCFWHRHSCPSGQRSPKTRVDFWNNKFAANRARDARVADELKDLGWTALIVWECELRDRGALAPRIREFLDA